MKRKNYQYQSSVRCWFFNPFKKCDPNIMTPVFNFLPQIGVGLNRGSDMTLIKIGWLNFEFLLSIWKIKIS